MVKKIELPTNTIKHAVILTCRQNSERYCMGKSAMAHGTNIPCLKIFNLLIVEILPYNPVFVGNFSMLKCYLLIPQDLWWCCHLEGAL